MVQAAQVFAFVAVPGHVLCLLQYLDVENCNLETASANCTLSPTKDLVSVEYLEASVAFYRRQRQFLQTLVPLAVGAKDGNSCKRLGLLVMQLFQASS